MSSESLTSSSDERLREGQDKPNSGPLSVTTKARSIRALARAEKHYESLGYDPEEAVRLIYNRAINYYDSVFPQDEVGFRQILLNRYERQMVRARNLKRKEQRESEATGRSPQSVVAESSEP